MLEPGYPITPEDLDAACELGGMTVEPGDVVLVRTGQMVHLALPGRPGLGGAEPVRDLVAYTWPMPGSDHGHRGLVPRPRRRRGRDRHRRARGLPLRVARTSTSRSTCSTSSRWG